eukprot:Gb_23269 [translate_table: standard]
MMGSIVTLGGVLIGQAQERAFGASCCLGKEHGGLEGGVGGDGQGVHLLFDVREQYTDELVLPGRNEAIGKGGHRGTQQGKSTFDGMVEEIFSCEEFIVKLLEIFVDKSNEDYFCTLKNLKQSTMFVDGLKEDIEEDVRVLKPKTLELAIRMATSYEQKFTNLKAKTSNWEATGSSKTTLRRPFNSIGILKVDVVTARTTIIDDKVKLSTNEMAV